MMRLRSRGIGARRTASSVGSVTRVGLLAVVSVLGLVLSVLAAMPVGAATSRAAIPAASSTASLVLAQNSSTTFEILNYNSLVVSKDLCLGITGGEDDAPAVLWPCNGSKNQTWHWSGETINNSFDQQLVNGNNECLGIAGGSSQNGAEVVGWSCLTGHPDQYWFPDLDAMICGANFEPFYNYNSGDVLGVAGNSTTAGASIIQWDNFQQECNNQLWSYAFAYAAKERQAQPPADPGQDRTVLANPEEMTHRPASPAR
jgi:hypothetical protein